IIISTDPKPIVLVLNHGVLALLSRLGRGGMNCEWRIAFGIPRYPHLSKLVGVLCDGTFQHLYILGKTDHRGNHGSSSDGDFGVLRGVRSNYDLEFGHLAVEGKRFSNEGNWIRFGRTWAITGVSLAGRVGGLGVLLLDDHEDFLLFAVRVDLGREKNVT